MTLAYVQGAVINEFKCSECGAQVRIGRVDPFDPEHTRTAAYAQGNEPNYCPYCGGRA